MSYWINLFTSFKGRIGRRDWWVGFVVLFALALVDTALGFWLNGDVEPDDKKPTHLATWRYLAYNLLVLWPGLAVYTRRLHDLGRSGWWNLLFFSPAFFYCAAVLSGLMAPPPETDGLYMLFIILFYVVTLLSLFWLGAIAGRREENRFGPAPFAPPTLNADTTSWMQALSGWKGRLPRILFWRGLGTVLVLQLALFLIFSIVFMVVLYWQNIALTDLAKEGAMPGLLKGLITKAVWGYLSISLSVLTYNLFALFLKRLHDRGHAGWWLFVPLLLALAVLLAYILVDMIHIPVLTLPVLWVLLGLSLLWLLTEALFLPGKAKDNKHGPDPLAPLTPTGGETN